MPAKKVRTRSRREPGDSGGGKSPSNRNEFTSLLGDWAGCAERCAREQPLRCVGLVFGVGLIASILPLGRLFSGIIRPLLLVAGVIKVLEEVDRRQRDK